MKNSSFYKILQSLCLWMCVCWVASAQNPNYPEVLQKSMFFYEVQRSGPMPADNRVNWRGSTDLNDGADNGVNLTGGWYDAGDHIKFNFPMAGSVTALAWGGIEYRQLYESTGQMKYLKANLKWATDYFIRCHTAPNELWAQVGDGEADHSFWGAAEIASKVIARPSFKINAARPGSDLASETAAALAATAILFQDSDPAYSATLITHAKQLYNFADQFRGKYSEVIPANPFYTSYSSFEDELMWGGLWMYMATNDAAYLTKAKAAYDIMGNESFESVKPYKWPHSWDNKAPGSYYLFTKLTGEQKYRTDLERHLAFWTDGYNDGGTIKRVDYTPGGLPHRDKWGSLRYASNAAFVAFLYSDLVTNTAQKTKYYNFAKKIIDYALGKNPRNFSYVVGYGANSPKIIHHRTAHGWPHGFNFKQDTCRHVLYGAMVGGPDKNDNWTADVSAFEFTEVACDYNALFTGAVARLSKDFGGTTLANFPVVTTPKDEFFVNGSVQSYSANTMSLQGWANNWSAWPAKYVKNLTVRFFMDISEAVNKGLTAASYRIKSGETVLPFKAWDAAANIYYFDVTLASPIYPGGEDVFRRSLAVSVELPNAPAGAWDLTNDWSFSQLLNGSSTQNVGFYDGTTLLWGNLPGKPKANFTATPVSGNAPLLVSFNASASTDPNGDPLTYSWDFGDGTTGTGKVVSHTYTTFGTLTAKLTVKDPNGNDDSKSILITVNDPNRAPLARFSVNKTVGIAPFSASFNASASSDPDNNPLTYGWDFGDGTTGTGKLVSHIYTLTGQYRVKLTVKDATKQGTADTLIVVTDGKPAAAFTSSATQGNIGLRVAFDASGSVNPADDVLTYAWNFGDGGTGSGKTIGYTFSTAGDFTVKLTVSNTFGSSMATKVISVKDTSNTCTFGTPLATALSTTGNQQYNYVYVLGQGGPNLSNVTNLTINWSLENKGLYQLSMQTNNGIPGWWNDVRLKMTHTFDQPKPTATLTGSGFAGLDGTYYVSMSNGNFVMVCKNKPYTLYFSKSATAPVCSTAARRGGTDLSSIETLPYPNPSASGFIINIRGLQGSTGIEVYDLSGRLVEKMLPQTWAGKSVLEFGNTWTKGMYLVKIQTGTEVKTYKVIRH